MPKITESTGTIIIEKTKRGFSAKFQIIGGKSISLTSYKPTDEALNGVAGTLFRDGGLPVRLVTEDGIEVFNLMVAKSAKSAKSAESTGSSRHNNLSMKDSFNIRRSLLPKDTRTALANFSDPDNFYLKLCKGARFDRDREDGGHKFYFFKTKKGKEGDEFLIRANHGNVSYKAINERSNQVISQLGFQTENNTLVRFTGTAKGRWIIGLGNTSVYENGMTLHHIYGIPYIPASSIKGMLRTWMINECFGFEEDSEERALNNSVFQSIFGYGNQADDDGKKGGIYFFDAFPTKAIRIEPDVMNNHYQSYYEGKTPPADWINPNPIFFLTGRGGSFNFNMGVRKSHQVVINKDVEDLSVWIDKFEDFQQKDISLLDLTFRWLQDALVFNGVGAKTAIGYGRISV